jgi:hypothetical protein
LLFLFLKKHFKGLETERFQGISFFLRKKLNPSDLIEIPKKKELKESNFKES